MSMLINSLTKIEGNAEVGGYTLPAEVTNALRVHERAKAVTPPEVEPYNADRTSGAIVATLTEGHEPDMAALLAAAASATAEAQGVTLVSAAVKMAVELTASIAVSVASDKTETFISKHLAPAHAQMLEEVREVAKALEGHSLDAHALLSAPSKVRNSYLQLPALVARNKAIRAARRLANAIGERQHKHDGQDLFALFEDPMALRPGWKPPQRIAQLDMPTDETEYLLWLASDAVAPGKPWLPTVEQQDAAWWKQFGEAQEMRAAHAMSARAYAGQRV